MASPHSEYAPYTPVAGPSTRRVSDFERMNAMKLELHDEEYEDDGYEEEEEEDEDDVDRFVNLALLSHIAVKVRDQVPRGTHVKGGIPYQRAFTGRDIVNTIQRLVQRDLMMNLGITSSQDRQIAIQVARSLQSQLFFYEVEWGGHTLTDSVEDVYMFLDDEVEGMSDGAPREELPTSVVTVLTKCYSASCTDGETCFAYACPRKAGAALLRQQSLSSVAESSKPEWEQSMDPNLLQSLPESEVKRQGIIHKVISKEEQYVQDLDTVESLFIRGLRRHTPAVMTTDALQDFIEEVFGNILDVRECNRRLLEEMAIRKREQAPVVQWIGDIFLKAAQNFRKVYPVYVGHLPLAEKRVKEEQENNAEFRRFLEQCARHPDSRRLDLRHFITRPSEHLLRYPVLLDAILQETDRGNPDSDYLNQSIQAMRNLSSISQLWTFQNAMGRGNTGKLQWHDLVAPEVRETIQKKEAKRQAIIFEVIQTEMVYVKDLEMIFTLFVQPLQNANPPIIPRERMIQFIKDVFYNINDLYKHHRRMLDKLHKIQRDEHPNIRSLSEPIFDAALNWREAYMEYIPHYPIAAYRIEDEMATNPAFKSFVDQATRQPDARRLDIKAFVNRPIPRLLRYELLLKAILDETPADHEDHDSIPQILEIIKDLGKATEPGVSAAKQKVELWRYNAHLVFKPGEMVDMDLLDETRTLIHTGKLLRQPETGFEWSGWSELFVLLFDNYLVLTKPKEKDGVTKYHPIPLDLLSLVNFVDPPQQRGTGILRGLRHGTSDASNNTVNGDRGLENDSRVVYPCTIHHNGRLGGLYTLYAESAAARVEWLQKLQEATGLRAVVQESNKVFEIEPLSADTFLVPHITGNQAPSWSEDSQYTGKVTCSVPFSTADGRGLVAIGCAEGVWIGLRHDSRSLKRVLHLKHVTQCAMLEDFGIFLVLADKSLFAYHIEALVPSQPSNHMHTARTPQKLNGNKDVQFFSVGTLNGRTLVIYMKKKGLDSVFRVLEPVTGKIVEKQKTPGTFGRFGFGQHRSEWFRIYRQDFFLPSEAYDLIFLKARIAILCQKGFEIMDLSDFKSVTIPQRDDPRLQPLAKRCEACKPLGMFRTSENEFLLCYNEFGLYVDRHGDPSRSTGTIEWEGTAEKVAWHPPYILLFDSRFIEIRHIDTGRLVQIIPGNEIRCLWDGRGGGAPPVMTPGPDGWQDGTSQESRVHAAMRAEPMPGQNRARGSYQHVFELVPTIPLYLPGSLSSPGADTYFPPSSPPLSPTSWT
ncbi:Dbl-like domain-containing protein [Auriculariales sp. MPI-PUGE-AT-0066]|nr:Dbl-like domain-containing protein [Auriculariales sp. MPI-PUGE-AT-0066]